MNPGFRLHELVQEVWLHHRPVSDDRPWDDVSLIRDQEVDWSIPLSPSCKSAALHPSGDSAFWDRVAATGPRWLNIAFYPSTSAETVLVLAADQRQRPIDQYSEPSLAISQAPVDVAIHVVE